MNRISISQAWSYAVSFFSGQGVNHAIALIGVGILVPTVLQFLLGGGTAAFDPTATAADDVGAMAAFGAGAVLIGVISYVLQVGSYFASWRIGLSNGAEPLGGALGYGLIASFPVLLLTIVVVIVFGILGFLVMGSAMLPFLSGGEPSNSALAGMGLTVLFLLPVLLVLILWLSARFCCTAPIMAERRSYNIIAALGDSWRLTAASQWKIVGYFLLLFIALIVIFGLLGAVLGVSMLAGGGDVGAGGIIAITIGALLVGIPAAYLQVGIPAGVYRALGRADAGQVFT